MWRLIVFVILWAWLITPPARADDGPSPEIVKATMESVVQVKATDCSDGGTSLGSGFVYHDADTVATALHVVAGCRDVQVFFESAASERYDPAQVVRVSAERDLALLKLDKLANAPALSDIAAAQPHASLRAIGFIEDQPSMEELPASVSVGLATLRDFLPPPVQTELQRTNPGIDLSGPIVRLVPTVSTA